MFVVEGTPDRTSAAKKLEYERKFPWMAQFAPDGTFRTLGLIKVQPPLSVKGWMHERTSTNRHLYVVDTNGMILDRVGWVQNTQPKNLSQRLFPKSFSYSVGYHTEDTLSDSIGRYAERVAYVVYVEYNPVSRPDTTLFLYKIPRVRELLSVLRAGSSRRRTAEVDGRRSRSCRGRSRASAVS